MSRVCDCYQNQLGGASNDGSHCKTCGAPASAHTGYSGNDTKNVVQGGCVRTGFELPISLGIPISEANKTQVGGSHYKTGGEEHWDRIWRLYGRGYFIGQITKYTERAHRKGGIQDLEKAQHFLQKYIELQKGADSGVSPKPGGEYKEV